MVGVDEMKDAVQFDGFVAVRLEIEVTGERKLLGLAEIEGRAWPMRR